MLLEQLLAPCENPNDHGWRKCKRCMAVHGIEMRFDLSMRLLREAADQLAATREAERTVASIAAMLGWMNVPPRDTLEADIRALKARAMKEVKNG